MAPQLGWQLIVGGVILLAMALGASSAARLHLALPIVRAVIRAAIQLSVVALVVGSVLERPWTSVLFAVVMFAVATGTAAGRIGARRDWPWVAAVILAGALPVLAVIYGVGVVPFSGSAIVAISGITIGGTMTAHTLATRRAFSALRSDVGQVEAALALGLVREDSIKLVIGRHSPEALTPVLDQTRTVGLVSLPGAFVGVLLGGGTAAEAAASQVLVLVGLVAAETIAVWASQALIARGRILPADVRERLPHA